MVLADAPELPYGELTDHWMNDIYGGAKGTETLDHITNEVGSRKEAIAIIVGEQAVSEFSGQPTGQVIQHLTAWHQIVADRCSEKYLKLRKGWLDRDAANRDPELETLNGIRMGVHRAMVAQQNTTYTQHPKARPFFTL